MQDEGATKSGLCVNPDKFLITYIFYQLLFKDIYKMLSYKVPKIK